MANPTPTLELQETDEAPLGLSAFTVIGLFGGEPISIRFPKRDDDLGSPSIVIIEGRNGTGKTTILRMISGMLTLDFDAFRKVPFSEASLSFDDGRIFLVKKNSKNNKFNLELFFGGHQTALPSKKANWEDATQEEIESIEVFRAEVLHTLQRVNFSFVETDRRPTIEDRSKEPMRPARPNFTKLPPQATKVREFIRDAQINHRRFFQEEGSGFLPKLLARIQNAETAPSNTELLWRVNNIQERASKVRRFGLNINGEDVNILESLISERNDYSSSQLALLETYVETQEIYQDARDLIAGRLLEFESIMREFLIGKEIVIDPRVGLAINSPSGEITENDLSSGEYHFLYMMVSALLCKRTGSVIAIDEPELSLHVQWQRKLINALTRCASGASPVFVFATHSLALSASHADVVQSISEID